MRPVTDPRQGEVPWARCVDPMLLFFIRYLYPSICVSVYLCTRTSCHSFWKSRHRDCIWHMHMCTSLCRRFSEGHAAGQDQTARRAGQTGQQLHLVNGQLQWRIPPFAALTHFYSIFRQCSHALLTQRNMDLVNWPGVPTWLILQDQFKSSCFLIGQKNSIF